MRIVILSRSARDSDSPAWGLGVDAKLIEQVLREMTVGGHMKIESIDHIDPTSFYGSPRKPRMVDIQIHLEVPCRAAIRWGRCNIAVINPEWWPQDAWNWASKEFDAFVFKTQAARALFPDIPHELTHIIHWRPSPAITSAPPASMKTRRNEFLYLIGGSKNKLTAAKSIVTQWKHDWPNLKIIGTGAVCKELQELRSDAPNIEYSLPLEPSKCTELQTQYMYHIVASAAEGFGHTFAEAAAVGALPIWTDIPTYSEYYGELLGSVGRMATSGADTNGQRMVGCTEFHNLEPVIEGILGLDKDIDSHVRGALKHLASTRVKEFRHMWRGLLHGLIRGSGKKAALPVIPPRPLAVADLPHVAIITLTYNRPRWWGNMVHNILKCDYPPDKLTWIIADDSDGMGRIDAQVAKFQSTHPRIHVKYLSMPRHYAIGEKRNKAITAAPSEASIFVMMDDDDHYPAGSVAGRVTWLQALGVGCVYCSTLPMYDCGRYISAINVPPLHLSPIERVSEASLCFTRAFFDERGFPGPVNIAEAEGFLVDRIEKTAEIPPEGIIVSFIHGANATSRRVPSDQEPNGCHYGFDDEFFTYLSGCAKHA
jgi:hypothetical protein